MDERTRQIEEAWTKHEEGKTGKTQTHKQRHTERRQVTKLMRDRDQSTRKVKTLRSMSQKHDINTFIRSPGIKTRKH